MHTQFVQAGSRPALHRAQCFEKTKLPGVQSFCFGKYCSKGNEQEKRKP